MPYLAKLDIFDGPVELLLQLVRKRRVDICDIPVAELAADYVACLDSVELDLEESSQFLVLASSLLELKSERLLPQQEEPEEETMPAELAADILATTLIEQATFRSAAAALTGRLAQREGIYWRCELLPEFRRVRPFCGTLDGGELAALAARALAAGREPELTFTHLVGGDLTVEEAIGRLLNRLKTGARTFRQLTLGLSKLEKILSLLALLELDKNGRVRLRQSELFGDIEVIVADKQSRPWWTSWVRQGETEVVQEKELVLK